MLAIPNQRVDISIGDPVVRALLVGTSEALGVDPLGGSSAAFHLAPGAHRCRCWSHTGGAEATEGAITRGAGLEQTVD